MNKCEWKNELVDGSPEKYVKTELIFYPCGLLAEFESLTIEAIKNKMSRYNFCPFCGADIRIPEQKKSNNDPNNWTKQQWMDFYNAVKPFMDLS